MLLDLRQVSILADYFVLCTAESNRQAQAILETVSQDLKQQGLLPMHQPEGSPGAGWVLLDYGDIVIHVFDVDSRNFYRLEELWKDGRIVVKMQ